MVHNGILHNDQEFREWYRLPKTDIETDYHYPELDVYLYASTGEILRLVLEEIDLNGSFEAFEPWTGEILCIDSQGHQESTRFDLPDAFLDFSPWSHHSSHAPVMQRDYFQAIKMTAAFHGHEEDFVMPANIETMFYICKKSWHGLGIKVPEAPTSADALICAGLDWEVLQQNVYTEDAFRFTDATPLHRCRGRERAVSGGHELP